MFFGREGIPTMVEQFFLQWCSLLAQKPSGFSFVLMQRSGIFEWPSVLCGLTVDTRPKRVLFFLRMHSLIVEGCKDKRSLYKGITIVGIFFEVTGGFWHYRRLCGF